METILITGGAGFIGSEIVKQLYKCNKWKVIVLDLMTEQIHGKNWQKSYLYKKIVDCCSFVQGSVNDLNVLNPLVEESDYIIHLAAETGTGQSMYEINRYNNTNIMGTSNLLQSISKLGKKNKVKKIILTSSRSVYGEGKYYCNNCGIVYPPHRDTDCMINGDFNMYCPKCDRTIRHISTTEDSDIKPVSLYAFTKYAQEIMLQTMCPAFNIDYTILRLQNVYGVGQSLHNPYTGILSIFSSLMLENKLINIFENGLESRDFINVVDVARTIINCIENSRSNNQIINIGSGKETSVLEIANILKDIYKSKSEIQITGDFRLGDIAHNVADISKAIRLLNFHESIDFQRGLVEFCKWVKSQESNNQEYEQSLNEMEKSRMFIRK